MTDNNRSQQDLSNEQGNKNYKQAKQLKIIALKQHDEYHPGGFIFKIIDNDGITILKEYWDTNQKLGIQFCRNWLKIKSGEELTFTDFSKDTLHAQPE